MLAPAIAASQEADARLLATRAEMVGAHDVQADAFVAWFSEDEAATTALLRHFLLSSSEIRVMNHTYAGAARVTVAGQSLARVDPQSQTSSGSFRDATVEVVRLHEGATIRLVSVTGALLTATFDGSTAVYANATEAAGWKPSRQEYHAVRPDDSRRFFDLPADHMLVVGGGSNVQAQGAVELWVDGVDLRVVDAQGRFHPYDGSRTSQTTPAATDPLKAETWSWTAFHIQVSADALLDLGWTGETDLFLRTAQFHGVDGIALSGVDWDSAVLPLGTRTDGDLARIQGPLDAWAAWGGPQQGHDRVVWRFPVPQISQDPAAAPSTAGAGPWMALILGTLVVVGVVAGGASIPMTHRWLDRAQAGRPRPSLPDPRPTQATPKSPLEQGVWLAGQGRWDEAAVSLQTAVRNRPRDPQVRYSLGVALARTGRVEEAIGHLEYAVRRDAAYLGYLVTDPDTESFRHAKPVAAFVRRCARRFRDEDGRGYA